MRAFVAWILPVVLGLTTWLMPVVFAVFSACLLGIHSNQGLGGVAAGVLSLEFFVDYCKTVWRA